MRIGLAWILLLSAQLFAGVARARDWSAIDALRSRLEAGGARVVQDDCGRLPRVLGLYHQASDRIVICRVHQDPAAVWDTLAHEAAHRMQACKGGDLTRPALHKQMARTLGRHYPHELASLQAYPPRSD